LSATALFLELDGPIENAVYNLTLCQEHP
jgi:hypothetical protein